MRSLGSLILVTEAAVNNICCFPPSGADLLPIASNLLMNAVICSGLQRSFVYLLMVIIIDYAHIHTIWLGKRTQNIPVTRVYSSANTIGALSGRCACEMRRQKNQL
jgi:hypothetical protein